MSKLFGFFLWSSFSAFCIAAAAAMADIPFL